MIKIAPSVLAANFAALGHEAKRMEEAGADMLHVDIMDGAFVPNISFGACVVEALRKSCGLPLDVHMMVQEPARFVADMARAGADRITVHVEATDHIHRTLQAIRQTGASAGVALNPGTSEASIQYVLEEIDLVLAMTVNPGFGGQAMIPAVLNKVERIRRMLEDAGSKAYLQVDGGVNLETTPKLIAHGADVLVAGTMIFTSENAAQTILALRGQA